MAELRNIGFIELVNQKNESNDPIAAWENQYLELINFINSNTKIPTYAPNNSKEEKALATWISGQRQKNKNGKLQQDRIQKLSDLGIDLRLKNEIDNEKWEDVYIQIIEFKADHANEWPELRSDDENEYKLAHWLMTMKNWYRGNLPKNGEFPVERYEKLIAIGFNFGESIDLQKLWYDHFNDVEEQIKLYGRVPYKINGEKNLLYNWISNQRASFRLNRLSEQQISSLMSIGIVIEDGISSYDHWNDSFIKLKEQLVSYNGQIPYQIDGQSNKIYKWLSNQKTKLKQNKLSEEQKKSLIDAGIKL